MTRAAVTPDVAGRCAFSAWRRGMPYPIGWDWADMSSREKAAWIGHATADGYVTGTSPTAGSFSKVSR